MSLALQLFFTFLFSCCMAPFTTTFAFSDSVFDAYIEFSTPFNIASEHKSVLQNITAVRGFTLILTITLPQRDFGMYLPRNAVDFEASVLCLTPLLPSLAGGHGIPAFERSGRCYALLPTDDMFFTALPRANFAGAKVNMLFAEQDTLCLASCLFQTTCCHDTSR